MGIATSVETAINSLLSNYVTTNSTAISNALQPVALTGVSIYLVVMGWAIARGEVHDSIPTAALKFFKISVICAMALTAGEYQTYAINAVQGVQSLFTTAFGNAATLGALIDNLAAPYDTLDNLLWSHVSSGSFGFPDFALIAASLMVSVAEVVIFAIAIGTYAIALVSLALVLAVGPAFILCALFPSTQRFTESWIGQALHFAFLNILLGATIAMLTSIASQFATHIASNYGNTAILSDTVALLVISIALGVVMLNLNAIASALSGGASISGIGGQLARAGMLYFSLGPPRASAGGSITNVSRSAPISPGGGSGGGGSQAQYQRDTLNNIRRAA